MNSESCRQMMNGGNADTFLFLFLFVLFIMLFMRFSPLVRLNAMSDEEGAESPKKKGMMLLRRDFFCLLPATSHE